MMSNGSVDKCSLMLLTVNETLALSVLKVKLKIQTLQSDRVFLTKAFEDKSLSNTVLDVSLTVLFVPICGIIFFGHFFNRGLM